jgi:hypothetical protein
MIQNMISLTKGLNYAIEHAYPNVCNVMLIEELESTSSLVPG